MASHGGIATTAELAAHMRARHRPVHVVPNGFDAATLGRARLALRRRRAEPDDGLVRIGYAGGTRTHQMDFAVVADALARLPRQFRPVPPGAVPRALHRSRRAGGYRRVSHARPADAADRVARHGGIADELPDEMVRFDINLALLEVGNPFCEAKSGLKFFEAALVERSAPLPRRPDPFARAIRDGETGFLAADDADWYPDSLASWGVRDAALRRRIGANAYHGVLWPHGEERRAENCWPKFWPRAAPGARRPTRSNCRSERITASCPPLPRVPDSETVFHYDAPSARPTRLL